MNRVARGYVDALGTPREAAPETVALFETILADAPDGIVPAAAVIRAGAPLTIDVTLPAAAWPEDLAWTLVPAAGEASEGTTALREAPVIATDLRDGITYDTRRVPIAPPHPIGAYKLGVAVNGYGRGSTALTVVPQRAALPLGRTWGIALQLYTLRSARNLGIGDFEDLRAFCALAGEAGASYVGINPLHAPFRSDPEAASPYAASSRRWLNPWYIAIDRVPEAADARVGVRLADPAVAALAARARETELVDYTAVAAIKEAALDACFASLEGARAEAFAAWCVEQGEALTRFAVFEVLVARHGRDLEIWPPALRDPRSPDVALFAAAETRAVRFGMYLQWLAAVQLHAVALDAARVGVRLYRDLAVGVDAHAADVWADAGAYVTEATVGAPPDELNTLGQDWGLPPPDPNVLASDGYAGLRALFEANCTDAGALRIDHAMSLARLYWIPRGGGARDGTYVTYPFEDLRGIVALASAHTGCVIIGEDLGTVPAGFREAMNDAGVLSYRILFFEREGDGAFRQPAAYPALALAASGTHDLPTIPAWLTGDDLRLRARLGLLEVALTDALDGRTRDRARFLNALVSHGDLDPGAREDTAAIVVAANRFLAAAPCAIVMAQLDDALGERTPVNVPGTSTEYPNWRRKLAVPVEALATHPTFLRLVTALNDVRPRPTP